MAPIPDTHVQESIVPRRFFQEVHELPIVASAAEKVTKTHNSLCKFVPLYQRVSSAALSTTRSLAHRASEYTLVKASVHKVEGLGLKAVTTLKNSCPIVKKPTEKVVEEVCTKVRQRVRLGRSRIATYLVFQTSCRVTEALVATAEGACAALIRKEAQVWTLLVPLAQQLKCLSPTQPLNSERHLRNYRRSLRAWRRSGTVVPSGLHNLKVKRRKDCFLTWFWAHTQPAALESCVPRDSATTRHRKNKSLQLSSPDKDKLSEGEERKLPQRKSEDKTMSYHDLLHDFLHYCSDEDSDYSPSETSTDSLEYRSTESEECEVPLTEDDFKKPAVDGGKNTVENLNATAEESNVGQIKIIVTDHEAEGSQQQQQQQQQQEEEQEQQCDGVGKCVDGNTN